MPVRVLKVPIGITPAAARSLLTKSVLVVMSVLLWCIAATGVAGDACKPDASGHDRISKKHVDQWRQVLSSSGFLSAALMDNDVTFTAVIERVGEKNHIIIIFQKAEENLARAAFESQYHATKGDQILFGFKAGDPVSVIATEVANQAQAGGVLTAKLNMSAVWVADVPDKDMAMLREALTTRQVDIVRITMVSGQVDRPVADKNGKLLMDKFGCFYQVLDKNGVNLSAATAETAAVAEPPKNKAGGASPAGLTIDQVMKMAAAKVPDDVIVTTIRSSASKFALSPDDLIKLKAAGVSDVVLRAMMP